MSSSTQTSSAPSSIPEHHSTPLESLVSHLLASKRSLSSINHVLRANELVTSTRATLESNLITVARTNFLSSGIDEQCRVLENLHAGSQSVGLRGNTEFEDVLKSLDAAEERLKGTLQLLRETFVEAALRPEGEEKRNLLDFVDESGVETLLGTVREAVGNAGIGHKDFKETNRKFREEVLGIRHLLSGQKARIFDSAHAAETGSPIPEILSIMEDNARHMADNLESLVKHYDLCVSAIKHTEGGGDAAQRIAGGLPEEVAFAEADLNASPEPISEEERLEMINVIEKDADQVEEVILEIRDRIAEMESQDQLLAEYSNTCTQEYRNTKSAFRLLEDIGHRLPAYIAQSQVFLMRWEEERSRLEEHMEELEGLRLFYDGFLSAYDNLLIEVGRRKALEAKVQKIVQDAMYKIGRLYDDDAEARELFKAEQGDFLPIDIWPAMTSSPLRHEIVPVSDTAGRAHQVLEAATQQVVNRDKQTSWVDHEVTKAVP